MAFFAVVFAAVWLSNAPAGVRQLQRAIIFAWAALGKISAAVCARRGRIALGFGLTIFSLPAATATSG